MGLPGFESVRRGRLVQQRARLILVYGQHMAMHLIDFLKVRLVSASRAKVHVAAYM